MSETFQMFQYDLMGNAASITPSANPKNEWKALPPPLFTVVTPKPEVKKYAKFKLPKINSYKKYKWPEKVYEHDGYMSYIEVEHLLNKMALAKKALAGHNFDTIAFRGMSGAIYGSTLAANLNKHMILVRKEHVIRPKGEFKGGSHSGYPVAGYKKAKRYLIVDDFQETGKTTRAIRDAIKEFAPKAKCIGVLEMCSVTDHALQQMKTKKWKLAQVKEDIND
jgi:adenine/guanine phosphoribosyltransferase-like PRPP-binding protein